VSISATTNGSLNFELADKDPEDDCQLLEKLGGGYLLLMFFFCTTINYVISQP
jgi:hypothetical protein